MALCRVGRSRLGDGHRVPSVSLRHAAPHRLRRTDVQGHPGAAGRGVLGRRKDSRLVPWLTPRAWRKGRGAMTAFFVPHDLKAPLAGAADGPLAGLTAAVKDMYDIAG